MTKAKRRHPERLWAVAFVWRGEVDRVRVFKSREAADRLERRWAKTANPDYDAVAIVPSTVAAASQPRQRA